MYCLLLDNLRKEIAHYPHTEINDYLLILSMKCNFLCKCRLMNLFPVILCFILVSVTLIKKYFQKISLFIVLRSGKESFSNHHGDHLSEIQYFLLAYSDPFFRVSSVIVTYKVLWPLATR